MPDKTTTLVVFESHEQTIIRRSRRVISSQLPGQGEIAESGGIPTTATAIGSSIGGASSNATPTPRPAKRDRRCLAAWWRIVALKGVTVFAHWPRRLMRGGIHVETNNHEDSRSFSPSRRKSRWSRAYLP